MRLPLIDKRHKNQYQSQLKYQLQTKAKQDVRLLDEDSDKEYPYPEHGYNQNIHKVGDSIARRIDQEKLSKICFNSHDLRQKLAVFDGRCGICTLRPPCKHTEYHPDLNQSMH